MRTIHRDIVGAFILSSDDQVLLGKTGAGGVYQDLWVVPGGGIETGETKLEAVVREVREEVGLNISDYDIEQLEGEPTGQSEKTLKMTDETVIVEMTFYDFKVSIPKSAKDIKLSLDDDLAEAMFFPLNSLASLRLGGATRDRFTKLGYL